MLVVAIYVYTAHPGRTPVDREKKIVTSYASNDISSCLNGFVCAARILPHVCDANQGRSMRLNFEVSRRWSCSNPCPR